MSALCRIIGHKWGAWTWPIFLVLGEQPQRQRECRRCGHVQFQDMQP